LRIYIEKISMKYLQQKIILPGKQKNKRLALALPLPCPVKFRTTP